MKRVTKEEFYSTIGNIDVVLSVEGDTVLFKMRHSGEIKGKSVDRLGTDDEDHYFMTDYYINTK